LRPFDCCPIILFGLILFINCVHVNIAKVNNFKQVEGITMIKVDFIGI